MNALDLEHIYLNRGFFVLADVNLTVGMNEVVALTGRSGSGKTTLFELIGNVIQPMGGFIRYFGREMYEDEAGIRGEISILFAEPNFNEEYRIDYLIKHFKKIEPNFDVEAFYKRLTVFGIDVTKRTRMLSKGQRKKLMIAFALSRNPRLLLMDEPTSGLDEKSREEVFDMIAQYKKEHELAVLFSTHHSSDLEKYADRVITIENGGVR